VGKTTDRDKVTKTMRWGDWNEYRVIAKGHRLVQQVNGFKTTEVADREVKKSRTEGVLALQLHAGPPMLVQFKDIQLRRLR
jgi:3-keto-disaccharide hydrolase